MLNKQKIVLYISYTKVNNICQQPMIKHTSINNHLDLAIKKVSLGICGQRRPGFGPSLSANRIIGYYRMNDCRAKARMILCECAR